MILEKAHFVFTRVSSAAGHRGPLYKGAGGETNAVLFIDQAGITGTRLQFNIALGNEKGQPDQLPSPRELGDRVVYDEVRRTWRLKDFLLLRITPREGEAVEAKMDGFFYGDFPEFGRDFVMQITDRGTRYFLFSDGIPDGELRFALSVNPEIAASDVLEWTGLKNVTDIVFDSDGPVEIGVPALPMNV